MRSGAFGKQKANTREQSILWAQLTNPENRDEFFRSWIGIQSSLIAGFCQGVLVIGDPHVESYAPVARWPEKGKGAERLSELCDRALESRSGLLVELDFPAEDDGLPGPRYGIAYPVIIDDRLYGVAALEIAKETQESMRDAMERLQWGVAWLQLVFLRSEASDTTKKLSRSKSAIDLLAGVLSEQHFEKAGMTFVSELASQTGSDRVSLGVVHRSRVTIKTVSQTAQFGERMNLNRRIALAMEESIVQRCEIRYPLPPGFKAVVTREHEHLAREHGIEAILTIPLYGNGRYYGAVTLERPSNNPFQENDAEFCRSVAGLAGVALENKRLQDRMLPLQVLDSIRKLFEKLFGTGHAALKLFVCSLFVIILFFSIATGDYRISADAILEGLVQRVQVAPFDGFIHDADVRAGDIVREGSLMCSLDDRDLRVERLTWGSQETQINRQLQDAVASHDRVQINIPNARLDQVRAHLELVDRQIERLDIRAPFDGVVVSGDLSQRLGGSVERGEVLFELTPLNKYRVVLKVNESDIADIREGQGGSLLLLALPDRSIDFVVQKTTAVTEASEGNNFFRVEARLDSISVQLRPGMEGVGKISVDRRRLIAIWTHDLMRWLKLKSWSLLP